MGLKAGINYVQIFENKGTIMGCSNPHPHGQIWAQSTVPDEPAKESERLQTYYQQHQRSLLADYVAVELEEKDRIRNWQPPVTGDEIMQMYKLPPSRTIGILKNALKDAILMAAEGLL